MKTALVIGVTGNFGLEMAVALLAAGWRVNALMRNVDKKPEGVALTEVFQGSCQNEADLERAAQGCELIVYAANPKYHRWPQEAMAMLEPVAKFAERHKLKLLFPGNVYIFSPQAAAINETCAMQPPTEKGLVRQQMEARLKLASSQGAQVTIVRAGDFLGKDMHMSWLDHMLKSKHGKYTLSLPHNATHEHFWSYLPDLCANTVVLLNREQSNFEVWHDLGLRLTTQDWQAAFTSLNIKVKMKSFPWWVFSFIAPFNPMLKEVLKMRYLWQEPVVLDGRKVSNELAEHIKQTEFSVILAAMIERSQTVVASLKQA